MIETKVSTTSKGKFDYAHDNLGRRTSVAKTGELYARYGNTTQGLDTTFGYDDRSQLTSEQTKLGGSATILTGRDDSYAFDPIGNRSTTTHNSNSATYTANALNQYSQRTVPGVFDVAGAAASAATVTVNGSASGVTRHGDYFFKGHSMSNNPSAAYATLAVSDGTTTTNLAAFLAGAPEPFTYDFDGNLTSDGRWDYTWDAESRLVAVTTHTTLFPSPIPAADARRVEFKYDYRSRRVQKTVLKRNTGNTAWVTDTDTKFLYDGWNLIGEYNALSTLTLTRSYVWGLDWSGSRQGAGGVGGLLMVRDVATGANYQPAFDGNGNLMGLVNRSTGALDASYEYDAFGNTLRASGSYAASNPFRFSTKFTDDETGLVYYGYRYYSPSQGRFINRDPSGERGGLNLYAFAGNNGVNRWDYLGRYWVQQCTPYTISWSDAFGPDETFLGTTHVNYGENCEEVWIPDPEDPEEPGDTGGRDTANPGGNTGNGNPTDNNNNPKEPDKPKDEKPDKPNAPDARAKCREAALNQYKMELDKTSATYTKIFDGLLESHIARSDEKTYAFGEEASKGIAIGAAGTFVGLAGGAIFVSWVESVAIVTPLDAAIARTGFGITGGIAVSAFDPYDNGVDVAADLG